MLCMGRSLHQLEHLFGQGLGHQAQTLGQTGALIGAGFQPYEALAQSGAQQSGLEQALIQDAQAQHDFQQNLPYNMLNQYTSSIAGTGGLLGNAGVSTSPGMSTLGQIGQLGMMAGGLGYKPFG